MIKNMIINKSLDIISSMYPEYDHIKLNEIRYGLESVYLSITKVVIILFITIILGIFKEAILLLLFFNGLRMTAFGLHAKESWQCWISSIILFIGFPYLCIYAQFPNYVYYSIIILSIICFLLYAPADTKKRPLVRKNRRLKFKIFTIMISFIYIFIFFRADNIIIKNIIISSMLIESVLIHPLTYKVFHLPYKNYKDYVFSK